MIHAGCLKGDEMLKNYDPSIKPYPQKSINKLTDGFEFVSETGKHICYYESPLTMIAGAKQRLEESGYATDFAEWDGKGRITKWKT